MANDNLGKCLPYLFMTALVLAPITFGIVRWNLAVESSRSLSDNHQLNSLFEQQGEIIGLSKEKTITKNSGTKYSFSHSISVKDTDLFIPLALYLLHRDGKLLDTSAVTDACRTYRMPHQIENGETIGLYKLFKSTDPNLPIYDTREIRGVQSLYILKGLIEERELTPEAKVQIGRYEQAHPEVKTSHNAAQSEDPRQSGKSLSRS